jgi:hypothetical protein
MTILDCLEYTRKNITRQEVMDVIESYPLTDYIRKNPELYEDILWLLDNKELTYIIPFKQKDYRTPNMIEAFNQFGIKITGMEKFVKLKAYERPSVKISLEIK